MTMPYFEAPPEVLEETESMRVWIEKILDASKDISELKETQQLLADNGGA